MLLNNLATASYKCARIFLFNGSLAKRTAGTNISNHSVSLLKDVLWCSNDATVAEFVKNDVMVLKEFVSEDEEISLVNELDFTLTRSRYQKSHWDDAIHGFRETEKKVWKPENQLAINRLRAFTYIAATNSEQLLTIDSPKNILLDDESMVKQKNTLLPLTHVLDLSEDGFIKPHVDSVRFAGSVLAVLSLLSDSILRLAVANETLLGPVESPDETNLLYQNYRHQNLATKDDAWIDILIPRRSVYLLQGLSRYRMTHAIQPNNANQASSADNSNETDIQGDARWRGSVKRSRRISLISRTEAKC